jgi:hypothetical protein
LFDYTRLKQVYQNLYLFISKELATTLTEEKAIAAAAIVGLNSQPVKGKSMPAARGIPMML